MQLKFIEKINILGDLDIIVKANMHKQSDIKDIPTELINLLSEDENFTKDQIIESIFTV